MQSATAVRWEQIAALMLLVYRRNLLGRYRQGSPVFYGEAGITLILVPSRRWLLPR